MKLPQGVYLSIKRDPERGYSARITFDPGEPTEPVSVMGWGWHSLTDAVKSAVHHAMRVLDNPLVQMALPPGVAPALTIVHRLADMAHHGHLNKIVKGKAVWAHFQDPTLRALAKQFAEAAVKGKGASISGKPICLVDCAQARAMGWRGPIRPRSYVQRVGPGAWHGYARHHHHHPYYARRPAPWPAPTYALPPPVAPVIDAPPPPPPPALEAPASSPDDAPPPEVRDHRTSGWTYGTRPPARDFRAAYRRIYGPQNGRLRMSRWPVR